MKFVSKPSSIAILLALAVVVLSAPAAAQPPLPHAFYGTVEINGQPAPVGTEVEAGGEGVLTGIEGNPITTVVEGQYGDPDPIRPPDLPKFVVQGDLEDGDPIAFYVNGVRAECYDPQTGEWMDTYPFKSGKATELNLRATIATPTPGPSPTPTYTPTYGPSPTPTSTPTYGPSPTPTSTPTYGPSPTPTSTPTYGPSPTPTSTPPPGAPTTATPSLTPTPTPSPSPITVVGVGTPTATPTPETPTPTPLPVTKGGGSPPLFIVIGLAGIVAVALAVLWGKRLWGGE